MHWLFLALLSAVLLLSEPTPASAARWAVLIQANPAGFIDGPGPYAGPTKILVDTEEEARVAIDRYCDLGFEQIKIYSSVLPELVPYMAERLGTIEVGKLADFVLVDGDPLTDISDIRKVTLTVKDGTIFRPEEMYQAIGVGQ